MAKMTDMMGRPHSGMVPFCVVGIVTDNVDPDELGRIQCKFPTLHEEPMSFWLRQSSPNAGKERGLYALPEKEDEVLVVFMQGTQDVGVILGQFWNGVDVPPAEAKAGLPGPAATHAMSWSKDTFTDGSKDLASNDRRFWKSRSGHLLVFDDTGGAESVQIWDKSHKLAFVFDTTESRILLTNSTGDIHIRTERDLYLEAGRDMKMKVGRHVDAETGQNTTYKSNQNITGESGQSTSMKAGTSYAVQAQTDFSAKASMGATVEGSVSLGLKGGMSASFEGGASAKIQGGVVTIN